MRGTVLWIALASSVGCVPEVQIRLPEAGAAHLAILFVHGDAGGLFAAYALDPNDADLSLPNLREGSRLSYLLYDRTAMEMEIPLGALDVRPPTGESRVLPAFDDAWTLDVRRDDNTWVSLTDLPRELEEFRLPAISFAQCLKNGRCYDGQYCAECGREPPTRPTPPFLPIMPDLCGAGCRYYLPCEADGWPRLDEPSDYVFVGSSQELNDALEANASRIALHTGRYELNTRIDRDVELAGACVEQTRLSGELWLSDGARARITDLTLQPEPLFVHEGALLDLERSAVDIAADSVVRASHLIADQTELRLAQRLFLDHSSFSAINSSILQHEPDSLPISSSTVAIARSLLQVLRMNIESSSFSVEDSVVSRNFSVVSTELGAYRSRLRFRRVHFDHAELVMVESDALLEDIRVDPFSNWLAVGVGSRANISRIEVRSTARGPAIHVGDGGELVMIDGTFTGPAITAYESARIALERTSWLLEPEEIFSIDADEVSFDDFTLQGGMRATIDVNAHLRMSRAAFEPGLELFGGTIELEDFQLSSDIFGLEVSSEKFVMSRFQVEAAEVAIRLKVMSDVLLREGLISSRGLALSITPPRDVPLAELLQLVSVEGEIEYQ